MVMMSSYKIVFCLFVFKSLEVQFIILFILHPRICLECNQISPQLVDSSCISTWWQTDALVCCLILRFTFIPVQQKTVLLSGALESSITHLVYIFYDLLSQ